MVSIILIRFFETFLNAIDEKLISASLLSSVLISSFYSPAAMSWS
jgi:hypothetical protein